MGSPSDAPMASALPRHLDLIGIPAVLLDADRTILEANGRFRSLLGGNEGALTGEAVDAVLARSAAETATSHGVPLVCVHTDAEIHWFRLDLHPAGEQFLGMLTDVTTEYLKIEHLRFTGQVQDQLMEEAQIGVWRYDPDTDVYYFATALSLGYDARRMAIPAARLRDILHRDDRPKDLEVRERITTVGGHGEGEVRYRHAHSYWSHFQVHYRSGRRLPSGRYEMYGITQDITPQAVARDRARTYLQRLKLALKVARAAVYEYDCVREQYWISDELAALLRPDEEPLSENPPLHLFAASDREAVLGMTRRLLQSGGTASLDATLFTRDGPLWVRHYLEVQLGRDGRPRRVIGLFLDIAAQKKQELALEEARRAAEAATQAKSDFLAAISHEIRTPLNGILGMAQSLNGDDLSGDQREKLGVVLESGQILMSLLNDVLDLAKAEAGKMEIVRKPGDLRASVERTLALFRANADEKALGLDADFEPCLPARLSFDSVRVRQCLGNLISNAIKFTPPGGSVRLQVRSERQPQGALVSITVSDTGIGMSPVTQDKLFSPFGQAEGAAAQGFGGTGLGLTISRELARLMGGDITVRSDLGRGSEFRFSFMAGAALPAKPAPDALPAPALATPARPGSGDDAGLAGVRVLLVDDNAVNRQVVKLFLAPCGVSLREATNGVEAIDALRDAPCDIVLLDIHMPVMDGCEAARRIRASDAPWHSVPIIALTADAMSEDEDRYAAAGVTDYLPKPVDRGELLAKMTLALRMREEGRPAGIAAIGR